MLPFLDLFGRKIPMYGICILAGIIVANLAARSVAKRNGLVFDNVILLETYALIGGFLGAKILYLYQNRSYIDLKRMKEWSYFNDWMKGGFVFFGGLIGALLFLFLFARFHKLRVTDYLSPLSFTIPLAHGFGRIGCFFAGCCYGIPYEGPCSVHFDNSLYAPHGISLFPVQLLEAALLFLLAFFLYRTQKKREGSPSPLPLLYYLLFYSLIRFFVEFFRYDDAERGVYFGISTSQYIAIAFFALSLIFLIRVRILQKQPGRRPRTEGSGRSS